MKRKASFAMAAFALWAQAPANGADSVDCATLVQSVDAAAASIERNSTAYWADRKNYVDLQGGGAQSGAGASPGLAQAKARALPIKAAMPDALLSFTTLVTKAQSADCISADRAAALKEKAFALARRVNFDKFPLNPTIEGAPATQAHPQTLPK